MNDFGFTPHFLVRIAGKNINSLSTMKFNNTIHYFEKLSKLLTQVKTLSSNITDELFTYIKENKESSHIKNFLNLKRDIFNLRVQKIDKYSLDGLSTKMIHDINLWTDLMRTYEEQKDHFKEIFTSEIRQKRSELKKLLQDKDFINAIQLSNHQLYEKLLEYLDHNEEKVPKKMRNAELSLVNYLNRMIFKPTPFSSFTGLSYGFFQSGKTQIYISKKNPNSFVRLNLVYIKTIERKLLDFDEVRMNALVRLNNTVRMMDTDRLIFFRRGKDGTNRAFSNESFVSIKRGAIVNKIVDTIQNRREMQVKQIVSELCMNKSQEDKITDFLLELEKIGLLEFHLGIDDQAENYLKNMISILNQSNEPLIQNCLQHLTGILDILNKFPEAEHQKRGIYLRNISNHIKNIYHLLNNELYDGDLSSLLFEDVNYKESEIRLDVNDWGRYLNDLSLIEKLMPLFDDNILEKIATNIVFKDLFKEHERIDFLEFYQKYKAYNHSNSMWERIRNNRVYQEIKKLRNEFYDYLEGKIENNTESVYIDHKWLKDFTDKFPSILKGSNYYSFYFQIANSNNKEILVINKLGPGYGKHFSRYCNLFVEEGNGEFINSIKNNYRKLVGKERILVDLNAVLGLNINTHPPILEYEITYPGCNPNKGIKQVNLSDIEIFYDETVDKLRLFSKEYRKVIELIPLGFLFPMLAPPLYKLLAGFSQTNGIEYSFWNKFVNENSKQFDFLPRLMLGSIVLDRKTWKISSEDLKQQFTGDSLESFINVYQFVKAKELPENIFLRVANTMDAFSENNLLEKDLDAWITEIKQTRHRKPQYLDFRNYFHIEALKKIIQDTNGQITVQEVLPHPDDKFYKKVNPYSTEFLIECY